MVSAATARRSSGTSPSKFGLLAAGCIAHCLRATAAAVSAAPPSPLPNDLRIDPGRVAVVGFDHAGDFAHQFHISFSASVTGSCIFAGQPFRCATTHFAQDAVEVWTPWTRVPHCDGCIPGFVLPFDHCRQSPSVVDVGSLVDFPRRHCGQNPISVPECIDPVESFADDRVFVFRGSHDEVLRPGAIENTVALLAQMLHDPISAIELVDDQPVGHVLPTNETAGYDGPGHCLAHVFGQAPLHAVDAHEAGWIAFNQTAFVAAGVGFREQGWLYIPAAGCGAAGCGLVLLPDTCDGDDDQSAPPASNSSSSAAAFARYAEGSGLVLLLPCVGGRVDRLRYPHARDIAEGRLDVFGQLTEDYALQSGPHMRGVGRMLDWVMGRERRQTVASPVDAVRQTEPDGGSAPLASSASLLALPSLNIDPTSVATAGCSNTADFAHQFHVAFSSLVTASCVFSGQPYHCAVTRFPDDYLVPSTASTAAGINCTLCPKNATLIYDHCKSHPEWVDVDALAEFAETDPHVDDPTVHLAGARAFVFGPTHDRCYRNGSMQNVAEFYRRYAHDPQAQIKLVVDQPFPHTLPTNATPYYNHSDPAGYDGPGECLRWVFGSSVALSPAVPDTPHHWRVFDQREFVVDWGVGMRSLGWLFLPPPCESAAAPPCKLLILPGSCVAPFSGTDGDSDDFARYAVANRIVILKPCTGGHIDTSRFPHNHENLRGMMDVYGQLTPEYATQLGGQMRPIGLMVKRLLGIA